MCGGGANDKTLKCAFHSSSFLSSASLSSLPAISDCSDINYTVIVSCVAHTQINLLICGFFSNHTGVLKIKRAGVSNTIYFYYLSK